MMDVSEEELAKAFASWLKLTFDYITNPLMVRYDSASEWVLDHIRAQRVGRAEAFEVDTYNQLHPHIN